MGFIGGDFTPPGGALTVTGSSGLGGPGVHGIALLPITICTFGLASAISGGKAAEPVFQGSFIGSDPSPCFDGRGAIGRTLPTGPDQLPGEQLAVFLQQATRCHRLWVVI